MEMFEKVLITITFFSGIAALLIFCCFELYCGIQCYRWKKAYSKTREKALIGIIDYLIADCPCDICQKCVFLREYTQEEMECLPDDVEPCAQKRLAGDFACKQGLIRYFSGQELIEQNRLNCFENKKFNQKTIHFYRVGPDENGNPKIIAPRLERLLLKVVDVFLIISLISYSIFLWRGLL